MCFKKAIYVRQVTSVQRSEERMSIKCVIMPLARDDTSDIQSFGRQNLEDAAFSTFAKSRLHCSLPL